MNALLLALLLLANPSPRDLRLEAAAFWAQPEALTQLADAIDVEHQTVALLPSPDAAQLTALLEGPLGRFVGGAVTSLEAPPAVLHLPISSAEWLPDLLPPGPLLPVPLLSDQQSSDLLSESGLPGPLPPPDPLHLHQCCHLQSGRS